jgi:NCS1 family nucleobase:cation symporter-1
MSDYARFARRPSDPVLSQLIIVPLFTISTCVIGIITTSCAAQIFPDAGLLWAPYDLLTAIQNAGNSGTRAAVFFAGLAFVMSQIGINIPCNAISGGIDLASMFPKYINIKRGAYIVSRQTSL